ncbi:MAG: hypothetical protein HY694_14635 [Deltaproteobacteria bacterium]|nr:hypothetical protein [Deltaproteobacteria bacterium]
MEMALQAVTLKEIEKIFGVLERLGISREAVIIPLRPKHPGGVRRLPNGKLEIIVDSEVPFDSWLTGLEEMIKEATEKYEG